MSNTDELCPTAEVAERLGVSIKTAHRLVARGDLVPVAKIPGIRGAFFFRRSDVEALAAKLGKAGVA